jgi:hypothetical protein
VLGGGPLLCLPAGLRRGASTSRGAVSLLEREFADLATYERQGKEMLAEAGIGELFRRLDVVKTEDTGHSELCEDATPVSD